MPRKTPPPAPPAIDQFDELELELSDMEIVGRLLVVHEEPDVLAYLADRVVAHAARARECFDECHVAIKGLARDRRQRARPVPARSTGVVALAEARGIRADLDTLMAAAADSAGKPPAR